jgi:hypothetical protein
VSELTGRAGGAAALLAAYDEHMRPAEVANLPAGVRTEPDGPIIRVVGQYRGFIASPGIVAVTTTTP